MTNIYNKKGQVILLALLIMAVVLVVALAIGTLMVRELRMAANIARSAIAYYAAESGLEEELWKAWKNPPIDELGYGKSLLNQASWKLTKRDAPTEEFTDRDLERDKSEQIYFPVDDPDIPKVKCVKFTSWTPDVTPAWLEYKVVSWPKNSFQPSEIKTKEGLLDAPLNVPINLAEGIADPVNYHHFFRFKPLHNGVTYSLEGYEDTGCSTKVAIGGGKLEITSTGTYAKVQRSLSITFYPRPPLHGIFDYVLFSDESIIK